MFKYASQVGLYAPNESLLTKNLCEILSKEISVRTNYITLPLFNVFIYIFRLLLIFPKSLIELRIKSWTVALTDCRSV